MIFPNQTNGPQTTGSQSSRPGLTLVEVLATIFILAVGSLSILVLFPVGAMKVKAALNNTKMAQSASNGLSNLQILVKTGNLNIKIFPYLPLPDNTEICFFDQTAESGFIQPVDYPRQRTSFPPPANFIPVHFLSPVPPQLYDTGYPQQFRKKWFSFQDDIEWDANGSVGGTVVRGQAFTTAYLIRKVTGIELYDVTILVYNGRSPNLYDSGNDKFLSLSNAQFLSLSPTPLIKGAGNTGDLALALTGLPNKDEGRTLAKGSWIVETSNREYEYYQIQSITEAKDDGGTSYFRLELDRALMRKGDQAPRNPEFYWVDFLGGVFPKGLLPFN